VCSKCNYNEHKNHILISKKDYHFKPETIDSIYDSIQCTLSADKMFDDHKPTLKELINQIEKMAQVLHKKIDMIKDMKIKEITKMFDGFASNVNQLKQRIEKGRADLKGFYNKNHKFFNTSPPQDNKNTTHKGNNKQNKNDQNRNNQNKQNNQNRKEQNRNDQNRNDQNKRNENNR
jgi:hypothetical protein